MKSADSHSTNSSTVHTANASSSTSSKSGKAKALRTARSVKYGRWMFVGGLCLVAAALGYLAYYFITKHEEELAQERFDSIAERALSMAQLVIEEKKLTTDSLAHVAAAANPEAAAWPNVFVPGFAEIATSLRLVTEGQGVSFCPLVIPGGEEQESFEAFSYSLFEQAGLPNTTGLSSFGKGVFNFGTDPRTNVTAPDNRYHANTSWTYYRSPRNVIVPFIQSDQGFHPVLMLNVHFEHTRGRLIDQIITCSEERAAAEDATRECGGLTDLMWSPTNHDVDPGPAGIMFVPIYPKKDNLTLTGFIVAKSIFHDLLRHSFTEDVDGVHAVLRTTSGLSHTYEIHGGQAVYVGEGDLHDGKARYYATGHINPNYFGDFNVEYHLDLWSTTDYEETFSTNTPWIASIGAVLIILFTSALFVVYDFYVRKEFHSKKNLLEAKRQFVRFVSHEVRTPLNTVCMGLTLLQDDFCTVLGLRNGVRHANESMSALILPQNNNNGSDENGGGGGMTTPDQVQDWMQLSQQILSNAETAVGVLNDLLNYDKIQMGTLSLELSLLNPWSAVEKVVTEFKIASTEKKIHLSLDFSPLLPVTDSSAQDKDEEAPEQATTTQHKYLTAAKLPDTVRRCKVVADNIRIAQVMRNLISNGLKFSKENGNLKVRVSEKLNKKGGKVLEEVTLDNGQHVSLWRRGVVQIDVMDDGVGMTPDQVKTVFKDGTQFNANKYQAGGGSGLGLNIAKGIATEHGGELTCASEGMGHGTTFTLSLPLYEPKASEDGILVSGASETFDLNKAEERQESFVIPKFRILVVDDSTTNRKLCMRLLTKHGHTCEGAADGKEGVEKVQEAMAQKLLYDCILMDYEMPNLNGPDACKAMRKLGCDSYIVGVTGNVMSEDTQHFRDCGANWVLPKPFNLEALEQQWVEAGVTPHDDTSHGDSGDVLKLETSASSLNLGGERVRFQDEVESSG